MRLVVDDECLLRYATAAGNHSGALIPQHPSPSHGGKLVDHLAVIVHYTAGRSFEATLQQLTRPSPRGKGRSAHVLVGRDGSLAQLVRLDEQAWHAGESSWKFRGHEHEKLNRYSLGVELDNYGLLSARADGTYWTWFGREVDPSEVVVADGDAWHAYTGEQLEAAAEVCEAMFERWPEMILLRHSDVAPGRKRDPGGAVPMVSFSARVAGVHELS